MDDKHIVAQARRGELSAFEELVTRYEKRVYAIALRSVRLAGGCRRYHAGGFPSGMALDEGLPRGQRLCDLAVPHHDEPVRRLRAA